MRYARRIPRRMPDRRCAKKNIDREDLEGRGMKVRAGLEGRNILVGWLMKG